MNDNPEIIVIGGSSGSIPVVIRIIRDLPEGFSIPVVLIIHRMKNVESDLKRILSVTKNIIEPEDKDPIKSGRIYLAPQNYHLLVEEDKTFSMDYSEPVNYSRPSIDVTFDSVSAVFGNRALAILLSGANKDGAGGMVNIVANGGAGIVQDPSSAEYPVMPQSVLKNNTPVEILTPENIVLKLLSLK